MTYDGLHLTKPVALPVQAYVSLTVDVWDAGTGRHRDRFVAKNAVVNSGLNLIRDRLNGDNTALSHVAVGTGTAPVTSLDTTLATEVFRDILTGTTKTLGKLTVSYYLASGSANGHVLAEAGIFNAASLGSLYARVVFPTVLNKTAAIAVTFTWDLTWSIG